MPNKLPPTVIASSVHIGLKPTLLPTTFGYIKLPSICCITINIRINNNDSLGLTVAINIAPITIAIKAPKIGIKAVIDVSKDINKAYGNLKMLNTTKNITPNIKASKHCPETNLEKVLLLNRY